MRLSVVMPVFNEKGNIERVVTELAGVLSAVPGIHPVQFIISDDHSTDDPAPALKNIRGADIKYLRLSKRSGSHIALRAGLNEADGDMALCMSCDGQDDPSCFNDMIAKIKSGANVVWALRAGRKNEPWHVRKPAELFYGLLFRLGGMGSSGIDLSRADFFLLDKSVVRAVNSCRERNTSLFGLILWVGFKHDHVEYNRRERLSGRSKWRFGAKLALAKDWIMAFSGAPIRLMSAFGGLTASAGLVYGIYLAVRAAMGQHVSEWSGVLAAVFFLGGAQIVMTGIVGEYLWHTLDESRKRPLYFIENK